MSYHVFPVVPSCVGLTGDPFSFEICAAPGACVRGSGPSAGAVVAGVGVLGVIGAGLLALARRPRRRRL